MRNDYQKIWETYVCAWKAESATDKRALFKDSLDIACEYTDPLMQTKGWDELLAYMLDFHKQIPGGYFLTHYFLAHHSQSIAKWHMKNAEHNVLGEGISYGKYNAHGKLVVMTGFFATPGDSLNK